MSISVNDILKALNNGLSMVDEFLPLLGAVTGNTAAASIADEVTKIVGSLTSIAGNVSDLIADGTIITKSSDKDEINNVKAKLAVRNDQLAAIIAAS